MGLAPAGVTLQAEGFRDYINKLEQVEKQQREVFDQKFKGTDKSFAQIQSAARDYERQLERTRKEQQKVVAEQDRFARKFAQQQRQFRRERLETQAAERKAAAARKQQRAQFGPGVAIAGIAVVATARQAAAVVIESARIAAAFEGQRQGLNNLAANYGQSADAIRAAMRRASQGVLSETAIINGANQALLLNVARTPEEFEEITKVALTLGRTLGLTATQSIDQFNIALGRKSLLILDNFGISARAVNAEIERLAQQEFGQTARSLSQAQRDALFLEAALKVAGEAADALGEEVLAATRGFDRLVAQSENLKIAFGEAVLPSVNEFANLLADAAVTAQQLLAFISAGAAGIGVIAKEILPGADVGDLLEQFRAGEITFTEFLFGTDDPKPDKSFEELLDEASQAAIDRFKDVARASGVAFPEDVADKAAESVEELNEELEENKELINAIENALKRAESLQLSFARAAEDAARKQQRATDKLNRSQFKERIDFLNKQASEFDKFQADEVKSVQEAEKKLNDARSKAGEERLKDQDKLHRRLRQAEDRFNLSRLQGERRFSLDDRRLRAEGDILGLQELRENFALEQKENEENFDLQQRQTKENDREQEKERERGRKEQIQALEDELSAIQDGLDNRRDEFLIAQEQEFQDLLKAQEEQRSELQRQFLEQEEDRRISQQRQLEDLGRSLAEQQDLTAEGAARIAEELETVFGMEGVADNIMSGFTARTESEFRDLFEEITGIVEETQQRIEESAQAGRTRFSGEFGLGGGTGRELDPFRPLAFDDGGIVPGPRGSPQPAIVHGGETVLPTHRMSVPIIPSQNLNVIASGRISVEGSGSIDESALVQVEDRIADSIEIAVRRIARRG